MSPTSAPQRSLISEAFDPTLAQPMIARLQAEVDSKEARRLAKLASPAAHAEPERDHDTGTEENEPVLQTQGLAIPARQLMICLRLATIFRSSEAQEALRAPGAFTVLRGLDLAEVGTAMQVLNTALPDHGCHLVAPNI